MKSYKSKKIVNAMPQSSQHWKEFRKSLTSAYSDASIDDNIDGYIVCYNHGTDKEYWSFSPKDVFDEGYDEVS